MFKNNLFLFLIPALIWGSTWYVIKYQLGTTDPIVSVSLRFGLAGAVLLVYSKIKKLSLSFTKPQHLLIAIQGVLLFGVNYWLVYMSELYLSSGLIAVAFSTLIFMNLFFSSFLLKEKVHQKVVAGALLGLIGTGLIYQAEFRRIDFNGNEIKGLIFCIISIIFASLGNITSSLSQRKYGLPVIQTNGFGMLYGAITMFVIAIFTGKQLTIDTSTPYLLSMGYLVIFGSIIAFTAYLTLVGRVGASKGAYVIVLVPVVALTISTIFEGYRPDLFSFIGMGLIIIGNVIALKTKQIRG